MPSSAVFHFGLDPVLRQRARDEDDKQRALAAVLRQQLGIENRLRIIQHDIDASKSSLGSRLGGTVDTNAIRAQASMTMALDLQARQFALELAEVYRKVQMARTHLLEASKCRKSMELLRERRFELWKRERDQRENREADDMTMMRLTNRGDVTT